MKRSLFLALSTLISAGLFFAPPASAQFIGRPGIRPGSFSGRPVGGMHSEPHYSITGRALGGIHSEPHPIYGRPLEGSIYGRPLGGLHDPFARPYVPEEPHVYVPSGPSAYEIQQARQRAVNAVHERLIRSPDQALDALASHRGDLHQQDQALLTRQIVARLATRADATVDPWQARRGILEARDQFQQKRIDNEGMAELRARVDQRCLDERLADVAAFLIAGDTPVAARRVDSALSELGAGKTGRAVTPSELGKGGALAGDVVRLGSEIAAVSRVEAALQAGPGRLTRLLKVDTTNAPEAVTSSLTDLRAMETLRAALTHPRKALPAIAELEAALAPTAGVAGGGTSAARLRQDVSARLFLEGRAGEARKLLGGGPPGAGSKEHAAALLRDLKAVVRGEGKVSTAAVADVIAPEGPPDSGAGLPLLVPEGKAGWKPPVRESPLADLGPVVDARSLAGKLEGRLAARLRTARKDGEERTRRLADQIRSHLRCVNPAALVSTRLSRVPLIPRTHDDEEERERLAQVIEDLRRPLTAEERDLVRARRLAGKSRQEIVGELRGARP